MTDKLQIKRRFFFEILIWMIWTQTILMQYVRAAVMRIPVIGSYPDAVMAVLYIIVIVLSLPEFRLSAKDILFVLGFSAVFVLECLFQENPYLDAYFPKFLITTLPLYFVGVALSEYENEEDVIYHLYILSAVTIIINFIYKVVFGTPMDAIVSQYQGDMDLAYNLLPHCCLVAFYARKKSNIFNIVLTIFGTFYLLMLGTRGAALILLINIAWNIVSGNNSKKTVARIVALFGAIGAFLASPIYDAVILWMYKNAQKFGLSIRIFDKLLSGTQLGSSGRDHLTEQLLVSIREHSLLGTGLCSDRMIIGIYAHNLLIELWVEFGLIIGTVLLLALVITLWRGYINSSSKVEKGMIITMLCASFFKMFLSGSYIDEGPLFLLVGLCVGVIRKNSVGVNRSEILE